jgi:hypothetical protein
MQNAAAQSAKAARVAAANFNKSANIALVSTNDCKEAFICPRFY